MKVIMDKRERCSFFRMIKLIIKNKRKKKKQSIEEVLEKVMEKKN